MDPTPPEPPLATATPPPQPPEQPLPQSHPQQQPQTHAPPSSPIPPSPTTTTTTTITTSSPSLPPQPTTPPTPPITTTSSPSIPPPPNPKPAQPRPPPPNPSPTTTFTRPWPPPSSYTHFTLPPSPTPSSNSPSPSATRGGMAIGVPANHPSPPPPSPAPFHPINSPYGHKFGGLGRNIPDSIPNTTSSQVRIQGMGMMGTLGASSAIRPSVQYQFRSPVRSPNSPIPQPSPTHTQNFQQHAMMRGSSNTTPQSAQTQTQPWLIPVTQGKPPLPPPSRPQMSPQTMQQRSHIPQPITPQQNQNQNHTQQTSSSITSQTQEQFGQPRTQQALSHQQQQQMARSQSLGIQRPSSIGTMQPSVAQPVGPSRISVEENVETCTRIMSKRTIHELLSQIDPIEKLHSEVEDILVDVAEEFVDSITTFGCSLAKHRKSNVLEAKDVLLHLERNWNITLPGFGGDEIKIYKKPLTNEIHRERLAAIKKSMVANEVKSLGGQASGSSGKSHLVKGPVNANNNIIIGSPPKIREAAA